MFRPKRKHSHTALDSHLLFHSLENIVWSAVSSWAAVRAALSEHRFPFGMFRLQNVHSLTLWHFWPNKMSSFVSHRCTHFPPKYHNNFMYDLRHNHDGQYIIRNFVWIEWKWMATHGTHTWSLRRCAYMYTVFRYAHMCSAILSCSNCLRFFRVCVCVSPIYTVMSHIATALDANQTIARIIKILNVGMIIG